MINVESNQFINLGKTRILLMFKKLNSNKLSSLATLAASSLSTLMLVTSPALAITFAFCGNFINGAIPGGTVDGQIRVDDMGNFDNFAKITTADVDGGQVRMYTENDFVSQMSNVTHPDKGIDSFKYTFSFDALPFPDNKFEVYLPASIFPITPGESPDLSNFRFPPGFEQYEMRDGVLGKEPDDLREVTPEPTSVLGTAIALGLGGLLTKKNLSKLKDDKESA